ncbi:MAG: hypothetical protein M3025_06945 [Actinomycetota bacterium]|nr:hypothetical protein [Actinomycetota bacterium]
MLVTEPPRFTATQSRPASCVTNNHGPYAKPSFGSAKRSCETPEEPAVALLASGAGGARTPEKVCPPSLVRTIEVHAGCEHRAEPSIHHGNHQEPARECQQLGAAAPAGRIPV